MSVTTTSTRDLLETPVLKSAISKASRRLMPMLVILYVVAFLDRTNVGFSEAALGVDKGISAGAFALGAGIFFIGYALFEIPSNLLLTKFGAKVWLARIAITWGIVSACFAFVQGETSFIILRFLLGVTEAGLFPGVIMFLAAWFPNKVRVKMFAIFYLAQPFSQMLGAPLSGWLINIGDQVPGVQGWQVMFFVEGMLAVVAGIAAYFFLINSPQDAKFLDKDEKNALLEVMALEDTVKEESGPRGVLAAMKNGKVWYFTVIYFCLQIAVYGVTFYLPQQVAQLTGQKVGIAVGLMAAIPWFFGIFACYFIGKAANTVIRRRVWGTGLFISTGLCIFGSAWAGANHIPALGIIFITLAVCCFLSIGPIAWSYPTAFLTGTAAAAGIGLINSLGNLGGFVAPILRTSVNQITASDTGTMGVYALGVLPFLAAAMMFATKPLQEQGRRAAGAVKAPGLTSSATSSTHPLDPAESTNTCSRAPAARPPTPASWWGSAPRCTSATGTAWTGSSGCSTKWTPARPSRPGGLSRLSSRPSPSCPRRPGSWRVRRCCSVRRTAAGRTGRGPGKWPRPCSRNSASGSWRSAMPNAGGTSARTTPWWPARSGPRTTPG